MGFRSYLLISTEARKVKVVLDKLEDDEHASVIRANAIYGRYDVIAVVEASSARLREEAIEAVKRDLQDIATTVVSFDVWLAQSRGVVWENAETSVTARFPGPGKKLPAPPKPSTAAPSAATP